MIRNSADKRIGSCNESYSKVFICLGADLRKCLICEQVSSRQGSFEHSKTICYPPLVLRIELGA